MLNLPVDVEGISALSFVLDVGVDDLRFILPNVIFPRFIFDRVLLVSIFLRGRSCVVYQQITRVLSNGDCRVRRVVCPVGQGEVNNYSRLLRNGLTG